MDQRIAAKSSKVFFEKLRSAGNASVASILGCTESTISEYSGDKYKFNFRVMPELLARLGLKIVPAQFKCYDPKRIEHILELAKIGMNGITVDNLESDGTETLPWDGDE